MIRFINNEGDVFIGVDPYIHWFDGQISTDTQNIKKLLVISDSQFIKATIQDEDSIFKLIKVNDLLLDPPVTDLAKLVTNEYTYTGDPYIYSDNDNPLITRYVFQILIVAQSNIEGQYTQKITILSGAQYRDTDVINVGCDFYGADETLYINLSNKGLELPYSIQKTFPESNINDDSVDYILINRKFKELISNYFDILDCRGSYKSLYNSLKWFEWGDAAKLYEVWGENGDYVEKDLELILSDLYSNLIFTHKKTTYLSLSVSKYKLSDTGIDVDKNPELEDIAYKWSMQDLMLKITLLGAFFERYFMPVHLELFRASLECRVFTSPISTLNGAHGRRNDWLEDTGVVDIQMPHVVTLGNLDGYSVDKNTVFGITDMSSYETPDTTPEEDRTYYIEPIGVKSLEDVSAEGTGDCSLPVNNEETEIVFSQIVGGVGVIIPVSVTVPLPQGDGLSVETITIYKDGEDPRQITDRRLFIAQQINDTDEYAAHFAFNLLSQKEEKVSFTLMLHSLSGHTWTAAAGYKCIDVKGGLLKVYKAINTDNTGENPVFNTVDEWMQGNPFATQYDINGEIHQYVPSGYDLNQLNELVLIENPVNAGNYDISWIDNTITDSYWVLYRGPFYNDDDTKNHKYTTLIGKKGGVIHSKTDPVWTGKTILRYDYVFIPQLHVYVDMEEGELDHNSHGYIPSMYEVTQDEIIMIVPTLNQTIKPLISSTRWVFKNMTTLEEITYDIPLSTPFVSDTDKPLSKGYWTVTMIYRLGEDYEDHYLTRNSLFKVI